MRQVVSRHFLDRVRNRVRVRVRVRVAVQELAVQELTVQEVSCNRARYLSNESFHC